MALVKLKAIAFGSVAGLAGILHANPDGSDEAARFPVVEDGEDRQRLIRAGLVDPTYAKKMATREIEAPDDGTETLGDAGERKTKELSGAEEADQGATGLSTAGSVAFADGPLPAGTQGADGEGDVGAASGADMVLGDEDAAPSPAPKPASAPAKKTTNGDKAKS